MHVYDVSLVGRLLARYLADVCGDTTSPHPPCYLAATCTDVDAVAPCLRAFLRDACVTLPVPTVTQRASILRALWCGGADAPALPPPRPYPPLAPDVSVRYVAVQTAGMVARDLVALVSQSYRYYDERLDALRYVAYVCVSIY